MDVSVSVNEQWTSSGMTFGGDDLRYEMTTESSDRLLSAAQASFASCISCTASVQRWGCEGGGGEKEERNLGVEEAGGGMKSASSNVPVLLRQLLLPFARTATGKRYLHR